jgi:O-antigen/teichoic acid export membrane protein
VDKKQVAKGVAWGGLGSLASLGLKFLTIPVLARLLSPEDFGVVAIALAIMGFIVMAIGKGGMGAAIIYYENRDPGKYIHTAFWSNFFVGVVLAIACYYSADMLSVFFGVPAAKPFIEAVSFLIPLLLVEQVGRSLLLLKMQYKKLAGVMFFASMLGGIVALIMAFLGKGAWSLIWQQVLYSAFLMGGCLYLANYTPKLEFKKERFVEIMPYALRNTASDILVWLSTQGVTLFIGRFFGASTVGGYQVNSRLSQLPREIVGNALDQAVFSGIASTQSGLDKNRSLKHKLENVWGDLILVTKLNVFFLGGCYLFLAIYAESVVLLVLGETFIEFWPLFRALSLVCLFGAALSVLYPFLKGVGEDKLVLHLSCLRTVLTATFLSLSIILSQDVIYIAYSLVLVQIIMLVVVLVGVCNKSDYSFGLIINQFKGIVFVFLCVLLLSWPVNFIVEMQFGSIILQGVVSGSVLLIAAALLTPFLARKDWLQARHWLEVKLKK